jgi:hypothetical protein
MGRPEKIRLGEILLQQKLLTEEQLKAALEEQKRSGRKLGRIFIDGGFLTEEQIALKLPRDYRKPWRAVSARSYSRIPAHSIEWVWRILPTCSPTTRSIAS